jgi:glyoxylase-like metal-dependent hydrolase (beta-lactamase superfamily II)
MFIKALLARLSLCAVALVLLPATVLAYDAQAVLKRAAQAMGEPQSIRYVAEGTGYTYGQAFVPGQAWPKITVHNLTRTINYSTGAMREEITLSRAAPKGGGGYPLSGQQRNDQFVSGAYAWNMAGANAQAGPRFVTERIHQLWVTPHGVIQAALKNKASVEFQTKAGKSLAVLSFSEPGRFVAKAFINDAFLVERVESRLPDPVLGETNSVISYFDYRDVGGAKFPMRIEQSQGGHPTMALAVKEVQANAPADIQVPESVAKSSERVVADKVADGVWFISGGSHNSVAIEMKDHMVLVEAPLNDGRSLPVIEQVKLLAPGKPLRFVINTHNHFDHAGGVRTAVAQGATLVTQAGNKAFFERNLSSPNRIAPDLLAKVGKMAKPKIMTVGEKLVLSDGSRSIELHRIRGGNHNDTFLMAYLPKEKLLIEADVFTPPPPNTPAPASPNANNLTLLENVERLKLSVDRILPLHGRAVPYADLLAALGK